MNEARHLRALHNRELKRSRWKCSQLQIFKAYETQHILSREPTLAYLLQLRTLCLSSHQEAELWILLEVQSD